MTPEKAIKISNDTYHQYEKHLLSDQRNAIKLSIEALIFRLRWEQQEGEDDFPLLPGETKE